MNTNNSYQLKKQQIKEQIKIVDIAEEFGLTVTKRNSPLSSLKEHDSVIIYNNTNSFFRHASGVGGDVLKFMEHMPEINMPYKEAFKYCLSKIDTKTMPAIQPPTQKRNEKVSYPENVIEREKLLLSQCNFEGKSNNVMAYLIQARKIDPDIVFLHLKKKLLAQERNDKGYRMAVFIGRDENNHAVAVCKRACSSYTKFKQECRGNDYTYGWLFDPEGNYNTNKPLICFESEIEKMSFMTLLKMHGKDINQYAYLSTGSASKYMTIVNTVERMGYKNVIIAYNDDFASKINAGKMYSERTKDILRVEHGIEAKIITPEANVNDWNDLLRKEVAELAQSHQDEEQAMCM